MSRPSESFAGTVKLAALGRVVSEGLFGAGLVVLAEWAVVSFISRRELAGGWELSLGLWNITPLAWALSGFAAVLGAAIVLAGESEHLSAKLGVSSFAALFAALVAWGVTRGRHFAAVLVRLSFAALLVAAAFAVTWIVAPLVGRFCARAPRRAALLAGAAVVGLELGNHFVLPRLYPAFHVGLAALTAMAAGMVGRGALDLVDAGGDAFMHGFRAVVATALFGAFVAICWLAPGFAKRLALADNLRLIFLDRGPLMGLGVELAARLAPPPPLEPAKTAETERVDGRLEVDWRGRDVLLISVDALRADHVGAYGYSRPTTPNIDALARTGVLFLRAYCPTPHTSYSVTSMMTGKNLRPLLGQGLAQDSDTFAGLLRTYGYRTAAFYPPAVFFIDAELFLPFRDRQLDFEYARVEFADPMQRAAAVRSYLASQPREQSLLLWVHLFEPHEPYVAHEGHDFGPRDVDRYDSEIAFADEGIGAIVAAVRARSPDAVVIVTADHGEEFGDHNGRYHGTTVYEEQVRVPLVISAPGLATGRIPAPVQTIDILPTVLASIDVPKPARLAGGSFARALSGKKGEDKPELAFAETDDQILLADGPWRLVCARRAYACALYNLDFDPAEARDVSAKESERFAAMKAALRTIAASQGRYESAGASDGAGRPFPDAIRRGLSGDATAASDIAALLDDSDIGFRRKAAEVLFDLKQKVVIPALKLALSRDEDDVVRKWCAVTLTRLGEGSPRTFELLDDPDTNYRRIAALALAENGDARGGATLVSWWQNEPPAYARARDVLVALAEIHAKEAAPVLIRSLDDVRLRPYIAQTLAALGQPSARAPLADRFAVERYQNARVALGEALVKLGAKQELAQPLARFLGTPDPLPGGLAMARRAGILPLMGGLSEQGMRRVRDEAVHGVWVELNVPSGGNGSGRRVVVRARTADGREGQVRIGRPSAGTKLVDAPTPAGGNRMAATPPELDPGAAVALDFAAGQTAEVNAVLPKELEGEGPLCRFVLVASPNLELEALAVVPLADELAPPPPEPWKAH